MILLDTNALIWLLDDNPRLGAQSLALFRSGSPVHYSSVSILEMMIKKLKGRLRVPDDLSDRCDGEGLRQMPFTGEHAEALAQFPQLEGHDPFDRALLAQAKAEGLRFLTADRRLLGLGLDWVLDATV